LRMKTQVVLGLPLIFLIADLEGRDLWRRIHRVIEVLQSPADGLRQLTMALGGGAGFTEGSDMRMHAHGHAFAAGVDPDSQTEAAAEEGRSFSNCRDKRDNRPKTAV